MDRWGFEPHGDVGFRHHAARNLVPISHCPADRPVIRGSHFAARPPAPPDAARGGGSDQAEASSFAYRAFARSARTFAPARASRRLGEVTLLVEAPKSFPFRVTEVLIE